MKSGPVSAFPWQSASARGIFTEEGRTCLSAEGREEEKTRKFYLLPVERRRLRSTTCLFPLLPVLRRCILLFLLDQSGTVNSSLDILWNPSERFPSQVPSAPFCVCERVSRRNGDGWGRGGAGECTWAYCVILAADRWGAHRVSGSQPSMWTTLQAKTDFVTIRVTFTFSFI